MILDSKFDLSDLSLGDLIQTARQIFFKENLPELGLVLNRPRITIREKIHAILNAVKTSNKSSFQSILITHSKVEIVVTFLAMLELIKRHIIEAEQVSLFDEIQLSPLEAFLEDQEMDLEFGE